MKVVLYQPQIPQNTGNIVRTCSATQTELVLIPPLGFDTSDKMLKRAGLDYWDGVNVSIQEDTTKIFEEAPQICFFSSHAKQLYSEVKYTKDTYLVFGSETFGLPSEYHEKYSSHFYTLPMLENKRCLNLSNAVAIVIYEAGRQLNFPWLNPLDEDVMPLG
jgi:tRNA (cytidine/uridine-2'-O-)-methyltransferase